MTHKKRRRRLHPLKHLRRIIAIISVFSISLLFLDYLHSSYSAAAPFILIFQLVPNILSAIDRQLPAIIALVLLALLPLLFGRIYCSMLCPLGIFQDMIIRLRRKSRRLRLKYQPYYRILHYALLGIVLLFTAAGIGSALTLTDPYSHFGRITTALIKPLFIFVHNLTASAANRLGFYFILPVEYHPISMTVTLFALGITVLIVWLSWQRGRLFCNTLCPVGALLGLLSRRSLYKLAIDEKNCTSCGACERECRAECIDTSTQSIDFERCITCYDCLSVCPTSGIHYQLNTAPKTDESRRHFLQLAPAIPAAINQIVVNGDTIRVAAPSTVRERRPHPVTPPGSVDLRHFLERCTACYLCVSSCPTGVLQPSFLGYFPKAYLLPEMDNSKSYCNYDCTRCTDVCPTNALEKISLETKQRDQLGAATFIQDNCIVYTQKTDCGACAEHCPTKAVRMVYDEEMRLRVPKVDDKICIGCGACEHACPTRPYRAIYVKANTVHQVAELPKIEENKVQEIPAGQSDFPF